MIASSRDLEKRLAQLKREVPTRGFERHPVFIKSLAELPPELCSPAVTALPLSPTGQTLIVFPPQIQRGHHYVPRQALFFTPTEVTHVLASIWPGEPPQVTHLQGRGLLYLQVTLLLLYGFLEIVGQGPDSPVRLAVEFNTVAWDKLAAPVRRFVQAGRPEPVTPAAGVPVVPEAQSAAQALPLKFSNGIRLHGLLPGETLEDLVFQPGVNERVLFLFHRAVLANTLVLLTSHYVAVIREELKVAQGWIVAYIPRQSIATIQCRPAAQWNELIFQLDRESQSAAYSLRLNAESAQAWKSIWERHGGRWEDVPPGDPS